MAQQFTLLNFVGYCDLASFKKVHPENKELWPENTGQPKSALSLFYVFIPSIILSVSSCYWHRVDDY